MSDYIRQELSLLCQSILMGALLLFAYDILIALRRVIPHHPAAAAAEDILYWVTAAFFLFCGFYKSNGGTPRSFAFLGLFAGFFLVKDSLGPIFLWLLVKCLAFPVEIVKKIIKRLLFLVLRCKISMDNSLLLWKTRTSKEKKELKRGMGLEENRKKSREKENRV